MSDLGELINEPKHNHESVMSGEQIFNRMIRMVSVMMLSRIRLILKNNGYDMKPRDALHIASSYILIDAGEEMITTDPDRSASRIRSLF